MKRININELVAAFQPTPVLFPTLENIIFDQVYLTSAKLNEMKTLSTKELMVTSKQRPRN